jgi:RND family efflux transporter MFP subunit
MLGHARRRWLQVLVLINLMSFGCGKGEHATPPLPEPKVTVSHPTPRELLDEDDYNGWLQASQTVDVRARVRGHIWKIHFQDGDMVDKDQLLFELDPRPFQTAIDAGLAQAKAVESQKNVAEKDLVRNSSLVKSGAVTLQDYEESLAKVQSLTAQLAAKMKEVAKDQLDLEFAQIRAPIAGRIGRAMLTEGNLVNAGGSDPLLTTIVAISPLYVYFTVDERALQRYQREYQRDREKQPDAKAPTSFRAEKIPFRFGRDTDEGFPFEGVLDFANNRVDQTTGTIEVRGVVQNELGNLVPGSRARVRIAVSEKYQALLVPDSAILTDQDKKYVLVVGKGNVVVRRDVGLGKLLDDGLRMVRATDNHELLGPNDWLITLGLQRARVNESVEPFDAEGQPIRKPAS